MKGSVQTKNGFYYTVIQYKDSNANYKQKWESTGLKERGNKKEANKILEERIKEFEQAEKFKKEKRICRFKSKEKPLGAADTRFVDYCKAYLETVKKNLSLYVYSLYSKYYIRVYEEYFKDKTVIDITAEEIDGFHSYMRKERNVKDSTLKHYGELIRPALKWAYEKDKIIPDNPYCDITPLHPEKTIMKFYNQAELEKLFEAIKGHKLELAITMAAHYGFRRSELLGLRWKAIDFDHDIISINHKALMVDRKIILDDELKTNSSYRTLPLIPHIKEILMNWKEQIEKNKKFYGDTYINKYNDYIFVDENGKLFNPDYLTQAFPKILKNNNLKHIRFHDLRHSCASLLLANGISLKEIQDWLGHSDFATTADRYSHLDYNSKSKSANVISKAFSKKREPDTLSITNPLSDEYEQLRLNILSDMKRLNFTTFEEYTNYLKQERLSSSESRKSDILYDS